MLRYHIEYFTDEAIFGWAFDDSEGASTVSITVQLTSGPSIIHANRHREHLKGAGFASSEIGFELYLERGSEFEATNHITFASSQNSVTVEMSPEVSSGRELGAQPTTFLDPARPLHVKSKHLGFDYVENVLLVSSCSETIVPRMGTVLYDSNSEFREVRSYKRYTVNFPDIRAYFVRDCILTHEYIVHDADSLYVDSSIATAISDGRDIDDVAKRFNTVLARPDHYVSNEYSDLTGLVAHNEGGGTWGHYLVQNFPKILLYLREFPEGKIILPRSYVDGGSNFSVLLRDFGIDRDRLLPIDANRSYRFKELVFVDFLFDFSSGCPHPVALELLNRPLSAVESTNALPAAFFVSRNEAFDRSIENMSELEGCLRKFDLPAIQLGSSPLSDQISAWRNGDVIVSVLGSDLANIVFAKPGSKILALSPDWFGDNFFYHLANAKALQWNEIRCSGHSSAENPTKDTSFIVDVDLLDSMLSSLMSEAASTIVGTDDTI